MIMFLVRSMFWISLVVLLLPIDKSKVDTSVTSSISANGAIELASGTFSDIASFCTRNPQLCEKGYDAAHAFGQKAVYASSLLYEFLDNQFGEEPPLTQTPTEN